MHQPLLHFEEKKLTNISESPPPQNWVKAGEFKNISKSHNTIVPKLLWNTKDDTLKNVSVFDQYNKSQWYPVSFWKNAFFKISSVVFHRQKKGIQVQSVIRDRIFIFCVNHPFNFCSKCMRREPFPLQLLYSYDGWNECTQNILTKRQYISLPSDWKQASGANK